MLSIHFRVEVFALCCLLALSGLAQESPAPEEQATLGLDASALEGPVPRLVRFSGVLRGAHDRPRTGIVGITFALYTEQEGGAPLWLETHNVMLDEQGRYSVLLGSAHSEGLPLELFISGEARWLGVEVQGEREQPRILLVSVPYALKAADAETLGGKPATAFVLAEPEVDPKSQDIVDGVVNVVSGTVGRIAKFTESDSVGDSVMVEDMGRIGLGTSRPDAAFHALGSATTPGVKGTSALGAGVLGDSKGTGVQGMTGFDSTFGTGVRGIGGAESGFTLSGINNAGMRAGVWGDAAGGAQHAGLLGTSTFGFGMLARSSSGIAVQGDSLSGLAADFNRQDGAGVILQARNNSSMKFQVDSAGNVFGSSFRDINTGAVLASAVRGITYIAGCDTCGFLSDDDDQGAIYMNVLGTLVIESVTCISDAGSPSINLQRDDTSPANILSPDLSCSPGGTTSMTFSGVENILNLNNGLDFVMVSAGGTARRVTVIIKATLM